MAPHRRCPCEALDKGAFEEKSGRRLLHAATYWGGHTLEAWSLALPWDCACTPVRALMAQPGRGKARVAPTPTGAHRAQSGQTSEDGVAAEGWEAAAGASEAAASSLWANGGESSPTSMQPKISRAATSDLGVAKSVEFRRTGHIDGEDAGVRLYRSKRTCAAEALGLSLELQTTTSPCSSGLEFRSVPKIDRDDSDMVGPSLNKLFGLGDIIKIERSTFDHGQINVADHVILVLAPPSLVAVIEIDEPEDGDDAVDSQMPSAVEIFAVKCFESGSHLDSFSRLTYWLAANPLDFSLALVDPENPANTAEWEGISVITSPLSASRREEDDEGKEVGRIMKVVYSDGPNRPGFATDVILLPPIASSSADPQHVRCVVNDGPAAQAGVACGDRFVACRQDPRSGRRVATFRRKPVWSPGLNSGLLMAVVLEVESHRLQWSLATATRAVLCRSRLSPADYPGEQGARRLAEELRASWEGSPICTTVPIQVWQRYIFAVCGSDVDAAVEVLRIMPCHGGRTLPSELWLNLLDTGLWKEVHLSPSLWPATSTAHESRDRSLRRHASLRTNDIFHAQRGFLKSLQGCKRAVGCKCNLM
mmetsp:Transcript_11185/g.31266  ORF Transcript_11185/g.31266 Transcript_11185/m.31266 type:complete len:592 (-) Transcript_11185:5-1780(-)